MKRTLSFLFVLLFCLSSIAGGPPTPPVSGLTSASNVAITGGTIKLAPIIKSATGTLVALEMGGAPINNYGQTNDTTLTMDAGASGMGFPVILGTTVAKYYRFDPDGSNTIYLDGVSCGAGKYVGIASAVAGAAMSCKTFQTGATTFDWYCSAISGAWLCE